MVLTEAGAQNARATFLNIQTDEEEIRWNTIRR